MILYVKNKLISIGGSSKIYNENKELVYSAKGRLFSLRKKKVLKNVEGEKLYTIKNKFWYIFRKSAFVYGANGKKLITVTRKISLKDSYNITGVEDEFAIQGTILGYNYTILRNGEPVGKIKREITWAVDAFQLTVEKEELAPLLVALVISIDSIQDRK